MFSFIVREFDTFSPFLIGIHLALCEFHHDVRWFESRIVRQVSPDSERTTDFVAAILLNLQRFVEVERVAEYDCFGCGIDAEPPVAGYELVDKFELVARVAPYSIEQFGLFAAQVAQEDIRRVSV